MMHFSLQFASQPVLKFSERQRRSRAISQPASRESGSKQPFPGSRPGPTTACFASSETNDDDEPLCKWSVQVVQDWDAVKTLVKVTYENVSKTFPFRAPSSVAISLRRRYLLSQLRYSTRARAFGLLLTSASLPIA